MLSRIFILIGTIISNAAALLGLTWLMSLPPTVTHSDLPRGNANLAASLAHPFDKRGQAPVDGRGIFGSGSDGPLLVTKTGAALVKIGADALYSITVCNTDGIMMDRIDIVDSLDPNIGAAFGSALFSGECETHAYTYTVQASDPYPWLTNVVTATYLGEEMPDFFVATATHSARVVASLGLAITKTGNLRSLVGNDVSYSITICSSSDITLTRLSVSDTLIPGVGDYYAPSLPPLACQARTLTRTVQSTDPNPLINVVTAAYYAPGLPDVLTASAAHTLELLTPALAVAKTGDLRALVGDDVSYPVTLCNTGDVTLTRLSVLDSLIPGVDAYYGLSLPPGLCETRTFSRAVQPGDPRPWLTNTIAAVYQASGFANVVTASDSHTVRIFSPGLAITKTGRLRALVGDAVSYPVTLCNTGDITLTRLSVLDSLIPGVDAYYGPVLPPGLCEQHTFSRTVQPGDPHPLINVITAAYQIQGFPNTLVASDTHSMDLSLADLSITKTVHLPFGPANAPITFNITFSNNSPFTVSNVIVSDTLPDDTYYLGDSSGLPCPACGTARTNLLPWLFPTLSPSATHSFSLYLGYNGSSCQATLTNTVSIASTTPDSNPGNNQATASYRITPTVDLGVLKAIARPNSTLQYQFVRPGERLTYTIAYSNRGPCLATGVVLTETLPENSDYIGSGWTYAGGRIYTQALGNLLPGQSGQLTFTIQLHDPDHFPLGQGGITNTVQIGAQELGLRAANSDSVVITLLTDWKLYVANWDSGTLDVFDTTSFDYLRTITLTTPDGRRGAPFGMAVSGTHLFVSDFGADTDFDLRSPLYVIDTASDAVVHSALAGRHSIHVAVYQDRVYVANHSASLEGLTIVNANAPFDVVERLDCDASGRCFEYGFFGLAVDETRGRLYATKRDNDFVGVWTLTPTVNGPSMSLVETRGQHPTSIVYNPSDDLVYVTMGLLDQLWVFDPSDNLALVSTIPTGIQDPLDPGFGGHGLAAQWRCVFVSNYKGQSLSVIANGDCVDEVRPPAPLNLKGSLYPFALYLPLAGNNFVPSTLLINTIPLSGRPKGIAAAGNLLFVTLPVDGNGQPWNRIAVIDLYTLTVVHEIVSRGEHPHTVILVRDSAGGSNGLKTVETVPWPFGRLRAR